MDAPLGGLLHYNRWANQALAGACAGLTAEQLAARPAGVSGSISELLMHLAGGQSTFVLRTQGRQHEGELTRESQWPGMDAVLSTLARTSDELLAIAERTVPGAEATLSYYGRSARFPVSFFFLHAVTHGCEHRTELKCGLAQLGVATPDLDAWNYAAAAGIGVEVPT